MESFVLVLLFVAVLSSETRREFAPSNSPLVSSLGARKEAPRTFRRTWSILQSLLRPQSQWDPAIDPDATYKPVYYATSDPNSPHFNPVPITQHSSDSPFYTPQFSTIDRSPYKQDDSRFQTNPSLYPSPYETQKLSNGISYDSVLYKPHFSETSHKQPEIPSDPVYDQQGEQATRGGEKGDTDDLTFSFGDEEGDCDYIILVHEDGTTSTFPPNIEEGYQQNRPSYTTFPGSVRPFNPSYPVGHFRGEKYGRQLHNDNRHTNYRSFQGQYGGQAYGGSFGDQGSNYYLTPSYAESYYGGNDFDKYSYNNEVIKVICKRGKKGEKGPRGRKGEKGFRGDDGDPGDKGAMGRSSQPKDLTKTYSTLTAVSVLANLVAVGAALGVAIPALAIAPIGLGNAGRGGGIGGNGGFGGDNVIPNMQLLQTLARSTGNLEQIRK